MSAPRSIADAALAIARERADVLRELRAALLRGDDADALRCARRLAGLGEESDAHGDRTDARLN